MDAQLNRLARRIRIQHIGSQSVLAACSDQWSRSCSGSTGAVGIKDGLQHSDHAAEGSCAHLRVERSFARSSHTAPPATRAPGANVTSTKQRAFMKELLQRELHDELPTMQAQFVCTQNPSFPLGHGIWQGSAS